MHFHSSILLWSIPLDVALCLATLVPLQILENAGVGADGKVVILPTPKGGKAGGHAETVQVAGDVERSLHNFFLLEVVARVETDRPVIGYLDVARCTEVMRIAVRITHGPAVYGLGTVFRDIETVVQVDGPRHFEYLVAVFIGSGLLRFFAAGGRRGCAPAGCGLGCLCSLSEEENGEVLELTA